MTRGDIYLIDFEPSVGSEIKKINTCELSEGALPARQLKLALAWAEIHKEELLADWELASKGELPFPIEPLK